MNYLDIILLLVIFLFFYLGVKRGFLLSFLQLLGMVLVIILVRQFGVLIRDGIHLKLGISANWALLLGYVVIFFVIMLLAKGISTLLQNLMTVIRMKWLDRLLGGVFNILFGSAIVIIIVMILEVSTVASLLGESRNRSTLYTSAKIIAEDIISKYREGVPGSKPTKQRYERARGTRPV
jgi:membrane protein required for colicin V production